MLCLTACLTCDRSSVGAVTEGVAETDPTGDIPEVSSGEPAEVFEEDAPDAPGLRSEPLLPLTPLQSVHVTSPYGTEVRRLAARAAAGSL